MATNGGGKHHHSHSRGHRQSEPPETIVVEGTAKRNILRKGKPAKARKDGASGHINMEMIDPYFEVVIDEDDPNYDSDEEIEQMLVPMPDDLDVSASKITLTKYKRLIEPIITEYFVNGDFDDFATSIQDIGCSQYGYELVKRSVNMSFDKGDRERELVSKLLCFSHPDILSTNIIGKGFERLFEIIDEVEKDAPDAREMLSKFVARAVVDEVLPPSFLNDPIVCNLGGEVVEHAKRMLSREHVGAKLESCWGPGDGRPVEELKIAVDQLLQEYLLSSDIEEATRCILELQAPHFYHEIVKRSVVQALDKDGSQQMIMSKLLHHLSDLGYLKRQQAMHGFNRLYALVDDLVLDTPNARDILVDFTKRAITDRILPDTYIYGKNSDTSASTSHDSSDGAHVNDGSQ